VPDVARRYSVSAMPTFVFLHGAQKVDQVRGANKDALESTLRRMLASNGGNVGEAFSGKGQKLGSTTNNNDNYGAKDTTITNVDAQVKLLLGMIGLYLLWSFFI